MSRLPEAVVLFGAGGFIGRNLVDALHRQVARLIGVTAGGRPVPGCTLTVAARDLDGIPALPADTIVINVAARRYEPATFRQDQSLILRDNLAIVGQVYAFCAVRGIAEVRQASSSAVYAAGTEPLDDGVTVDLNQHPHAGELGYAWSRRMAEISADLHHRLYGIHTQSFRLTNPFGAHDTTDAAGAHVATALVIRALTESGPLHLLGNPDAERDFVYAADVARIFVESCRQRGIHDCLNLARGETISIRGFAQLVLDAAGGHRPIEVSANLPPGVNVRRATGRRLAERFPTVVLRPLADGVRETVQWYRHVLAR